MPPPDPTRPPLARPSTLAPFRVRSFRFQWPADLATSWAFEMETLILGWFVLVETQSVLLLTLFGALQFVGTLIAPMFGAIGDRIGHRNLLCGMRFYYGILAAGIAGLAIGGVLQPIHVFVVTTLSGLVRQSDLVMRNALVGETIPPQQLMGAMSIARTTSDSARIAGALAGAGLFATLGMGQAYLVISAFYAGSFLLSLGIAGRAVRSPSPEDAARPRPSPWQDLLRATTYVWNTPELQASLGIAFLVNLTAFPITNGLLPYAASEIYRTDQTGLGYLVAGFAGGALIGSMLLSRFGHGLRPAPMMIAFCACWYVALIAFAATGSLWTGVLMLAVAGFVQSLCLVPLAVLMLRGTDPLLRGRVMGLRMLAVYGLPLGLLAAGPLIKEFGYPATTVIYGVFGLACTALVALRWRRHLWGPQARSAT
ncbi:MAG: MFS transporter [Alphaproteobacteria bacterium]|nr:MFS transporter [Alphaproteobacteria bacterium]